MKNKNNTFKPRFIVDLTECYSPEDVVLEFANTKYNNNIKLERFEIDALVNNATETAIRTVFDTLMFSMINSTVKSIADVIERNTTEKPIKKEGFFKRMWHKMFKKNAK